MKALYHFAALSCLLLCGCMGSGTSETTPPPAAPLAATENPPPARDVIRAGDKIMIRLSGVPDNGYDVEVQIPASGEVTVAYLTRSFQAIGRNATDLAEEITEAYKNEKIYTNPNVTVLPEERYVNVSGDVRSPSRVIYTPDLTLLTSIVSAGGFTEYADRHHVRILRGQQTLQVDAVAAQRTASADVPVYPGDQIYVPRTIF